MPDKPIPVTENQKPAVFYGYYIVAAVFSVVAVCSGTQYTFGVFFEPLREEFKWSSMMTSAAYSLYAILNGAITILASRLTDRFGPRPVLTAAGLLSGLGYILMSRVTEIWQFYLLYGVLVSIGMSGGTIPSISLIARWFVKRRSTMTAVVMTGMGAGTSIAPVLAAWLIGVYDWRQSYIILGVATLLMIVAAAQFTKRDPYVMKLLPYGATGSEAENHQNESNGLSLAQSLRTRPLWLVSIIALLYALSSGVIVVHVVSSAIELGNPPAGSAAILSIMGVFAMLGYLVLGSTADRLGNYRVLLIGFILMTVATMPLVVARELWTFYLFAAIFGFGTGGWTVMAPLIAGLFGMKAHGELIGFIYFISSLGAVIGPIAAGQIFDQSQSYFYAWLLVFGVCFICAAAVWLLRLAGKPIRPP